MKKAYLSLVRVYHNGATALVQDAEKEYCLSVDDMIVASYITHFNSEPEPDHVKKANALWALVQKLDSIEVVYDKEVQNETSSVSN